MKKRRRDMNKTVRFIVVFVVFLGYSLVGHWAVPEANAEDVTYTFVFKNENLEAIKEVQAELRMNAGGGYAPLEKKYVWPLSIKAGESYTLTVNHSKGAATAFGPSRVDFINIMVAFGPWLKPNGHLLQFQRMVKNITRADKTHYVINVSRSADMGTVYLQIQ